MGKGCIAAVPLVYAALLAFLLAGCAAQPPAADAEKVDRILILIQERLGYMDDVARNKWNSGAPIEDLPREREIIEGLGRQAPAYGLDATIAKDFFRAQIEASKMIQTARFAEWRAQKHPPFANIPDLRDRIRPALDALTPQMMEALAAALPVLKAPDGAALVAARVNAILGGYGDIAARDEAITPLRRIGQPR
jgi:chorismate mutase